MEVGILGPVEIRHLGTPIHLARKQERIILGVLALHVNQVVPIDRLIGLVWGNEPIPGARKSLYIRISQLRKRLESASGTDKEFSLTSRENGYELRLVADSVDLHKFRMLVAAADDTTDDEAARQRLRDALELWRGTFFGANLGDLQLQTVTTSLEAERLSAFEKVFERELRLGRAQAIVDEVTALAIEHSDRDLLVAQMIRSLHGTGRDAEAIHAYHDYRKRIADDLGIDPPPIVQNSYLTILRDQDDTDISEHEGAETEKAAPPAIFDYEWPVPQTLPPDISGFAGRKNELESLVGSLTSPDRNAIPVVAISGTGGIGKTALSIRLAHMVSDDYPDGQLYTNLHGHDVDTASDPSAVLGNFLRRLGIDAAAVPDGGDERAALYRDLLAERKVLVVLDNAADDQQVLPLIPASLTCGVIINSRTRVGITFRATRLNLDLLSPREAIQVLATTIGPERLANESANADELARYCGYLPLALRVVGARLAAKPHWTIGKLLDALRDQRRRLDELSHGYLDVRSSIALSYLDLPSEAQSLLRRLGDFDLPEINVWTASALMDSTSADAEALLEQLFDAQLLDVFATDPDGGPRYRMHDLVRLYAQERAEHDESPDELSSARQRAYSVWLFVADTFYTALFGGSYQNVHGGHPRISIDDDHVLSSIRDHWLEWFQTEQTNITAVIRRAGADQVSEVCWDLASTTDRLFTGHYSFTESRTVLNYALSVTTTAKDAHGQAVVLLRLGISRINHTEYDAAREALTRSAELFQDTGDQHGHALVLSFVALVDRSEHQEQAAMENYRIALPVLRETRDYGGSAFVLRGMGQVRRSLGDLEDAEKLFEDALQFCREGNSRLNEAQVLFWIGMLRLDQGNYAQAEDCFRIASEISSQLGEQTGQAQCLRGLGRSYALQGDRELGRSTLRRAIRMVQTPRLVTYIEASIREELESL